MEFHILKALKPIFFLISYLFGDVSQFVTHFLSLYNLIEHKEIPKKAL